MSPDLLFWLSLGLKMAVTAGFVIGAAMVAERAGPAIGALVATLPIAAGPAYVFVALDHDAAFISQSAIGSIAAHAATGVFSLAYVLLAQRCSVAISVGGAIAVWFVVAFALRSVPWTFLGVAAANLATYAVCIVLTERYRHVRMPPIGRRWYDLPLRAVMVSCLVAAVVGLSGRVGPTVTGLLAVFPIVMTSLMLIFQTRVGGPADRRVDRQHHVGPGRLQRLSVHGASCHRAARNLGRAFAVARRVGGVEFGAMVAAPAQTAAAAPLNAKDRRPRGRRPWQRRCRANARSPALVP